MPLMHKNKKGSDAERDLVHRFFDAGWMAMRAAGSGSIGLPCPDVIAGNGARRIVIECKAVGADAKYLTKHEVEELLLFAKTFGAEAWLGIRFDRMSWRFVSLEDARATDRSVVVSRSLAQARGLTFEELLGK
jgi:holliday junction resolvase Hjr